MARVASITRTIKSNEVTVMAVNTAEDTLTSEVVTVPRNCTKERDILKYIDRNNLLGNFTKAVMVKEIKVVEAKYTMLESDFIAHAKQI